jgi:hypothetical protein
MTLVGGLSEGLHLIPSTARTGLSGEGIFFSDKFFLRDRFASFRFRRKYCPLVGMI